MTTIGVRGGATAEEVAAVLAALRSTGRPTATSNGGAPADRYAAWRRARLAAVREQSWPPR